MVSDQYKEQVRLLLQVLPEAAREDCFALHGGTAINLFIRDMPRLSVDIDLTYLPIEDRRTSLLHINEALARIKERVERIITGVDIRHKRDTTKLFINTHTAQVKLEVNQIMRGAISDPVRWELCASAGKEYEAYAAMQIVPPGQLYGGKICAALDRQHPRDLFDVSYLLGENGFSDEVRCGTLFGLVSSARPIHELLAPELKDQRKALDNQFAGMTATPFTHEQYESTRLQLISTIREKLTDEDKRFLVSIKELSPDWDIYDFRRFPAVRWKLENLGKLRDTNSRKYAEQVAALRETLS